MARQTVWFHGRARLAALVLLGSTPLDDVSTDDDGSCLRVELDDDLHHRMSSGQRHLWEFLSSLAGNGAVNIWSAMQAVDAACQRAAWQALGVLIGEVEVASLQEATA